MFQRLLLLLAALFPWCLRADVTLAPLFADHAVLQQGRPVPVWGRAAPGEKVSVAFRDQTVAAAAGPDDRWVAWLEPLKPGAPAELVVTGRNVLKVQDVVVGEVWVCSGQSNMEFTVRGVLRVNNADEEVAAAQYPLIRQFAVEKTVADRPADRVRGAWAVCSPETAGNFTAVGYFFARDLYQKLGVPVGLINSSWGGTPIEPWISEDALAGDPAFAVVKERWKQAVAEFPSQAAYEAARAEFTKAAAAAYEAWMQAPPAEKAACLARLGAVYSHTPHGHGDPATPAGLFNGMINPLIPYGIRGALWYQGESNAGMAAEYHALFAAMITDWRKHWGQGDFPFYWVQLANFSNSDPADTSWARLREAQTQTLTLPNTGMAVTIDIGDPGDIHPRNKQEVGRRLALIARHHLYDIPGDWSGPMFKSAAREGAAMRVRFDHADGGLVAHDRPPAGFQIAGADRQFHPATARIERDTVVVSAPEVKEPVAVRYAWTNAPEANLYDGAGLPAGPFRSDNW